MNWKTPWSKSNAVDHRAKELEEEQLHLTRQMEELQQQIAALKNPPPPPTVQPVWRSTKSTEPLPSGTSPSGSSSNKITPRPNRAQQKQDRNLFIMLAVILAFIFFLMIRALR